MRAATETEAPNWNEEDTAFVDSLVDKAFKQQRAAHAAGNHKLFKEIDELLIGIMSVKELLEAFRASPDNKINGVHGVAKRLNLTRNGVYCRLDMVKLDPADFRDSDALLGDLVKKSRTLGRMARKVLTHSDRES
jgi:hypothetical protein